MASTSRGRDRLLFGVSLLLMILALANKYSYYPFSSEARSRQHSRPRQPAHTSRNNEATYGAHNTSFETRVHWMRRAISALPELTTSPCPFGAFGSAIVNHTAESAMGELVCIGVNSVKAEGNPILHGMSALLPTTKTKASS